MNTQTQQTHAQRITEAIVMTPELEKMCRLAQKRGWDFEINPNLEGWTVVPLTDESIYPSEGVKRLREIRKKIKNKGFLVSHEPGKVPKPKPPQFQPPEIDWGEALMTVAKIAAVCAGLVLVAYAVVACAALLIAGAVAAALISDPKLICQVDNGDGTVINVSFYAWEE